MASSHSFDQVERGGRGDGWDRRQEEAGIEAGGRRRKGHEETSNAVGRSDSVSSSVTPGEANRCGISF